MLTTGGGAAGSTGAGAALAEGAGGGGVAAVDAAGAPDGIAEGALTGAAVSTRPTRDAADEGGPPELREKKNAPASPATASAPTIGTHGDRR